MKFLIESEAAGDGDTRRRATCEAIGSIKVLAEAMAAAMRLDERIATIVMSAIVFFESDMELEDGTVVDLHNKKPND